MSNIYVERSDIQNIANAIREKKGTQNTMLVSEMATEISTIPSGSQYSTDWSVLGYNFVPTAVTTDVNYSLTIMQNWDNTQTNTTDKFLNDTSFVYFPLVDMSNVTNATRMLKGCSNLVSCTMLDFSSINAIKSFFEGCSNLVDVPQFDLSTASTMTDMFKNCAKLSDDSLNNILAMCTNATYFMQTQATRYWTLAYMGLNSSQATKCQSLSNYTAFVNAGWSTGY